MYIRCPEFKLSNAKRKGGKEGRERRVWEHSLVVER
jgi:hypothetical protein